MIETREVNGKKDWELFIEVPFQLFKSDSVWVPPLRVEVRKNLDPRKNPFFQHGNLKAWYVQEGNKLLGRIAAFVDLEYNQYHQCQVGFFGFFDCVDQPSVAKILIEKASEWLKTQGMHQIIGPVNLSIGNECGIQLDGFELPPKIQMNYTPSFYRDLIEDLGFTKEHDLFAYQISAEAAKKNGTLMERLKKVADHALSKENIRIRPIDLKHFDREVLGIREIFNETMSENWGFVPLSLEEAKFIGKSLRQIVDPDLVLMAEVNGELAGFSLTLPDFNQALHRNKSGKLLPFGLFKVLYFSRKIDQVRLYLMGMKSNYRNRGLDVVFYQQSILKTLEKGYKGGECSWVSEDNKNLIKILETLGAICYKTYRVYKKSL